MYKFMATVGYLGGIWITSYVFILSLIGSFKAINEKEDHKLVSHVCAISFVLTILFIYGFLVSYI